VSVENAKTYQSKISFPSPGLKNELKRYQHEVVSKKRLLLSKHEANIETIVLYKVQ
jgi:hypothetical protein